ncbi:uncharacterized protein [Salvelinus sp. IW2-2015]|uniref:uncharacterized protein n=1 Tax=Salvelinus sp. IW2-2015 TaxID=2691554 RepID=UPI0038D3E03F
MQTTGTQEMPAAFNTNIMGPMDVIKEFLPDLQAAATASGKPEMSCSKPAVVSISSTVGSMATVKEMTVAILSSLWHQQSKQTSVTLPVITHPLPSHYIPCQVSPAMSVEAGVNLNRRTGSSWFYIQSIVLYPHLFNSLPPFSLPAPPFLSSQAGLNMLTFCSTEEFRKDEILFAVLHPGWVRTDMGGKGAAIDAPESVEGLLCVMVFLTEKQIGAFLDYEGKVMPW